MHESLLFGVLYSLKEIKKQLKDLTELYEDEVNANIKKSEAIKDLYKRLHSEHGARMQAVTTLMRLRQHVSDEKLLQDIDKLLEPYKSL